MNQLLVLIIISILIIILLLFLVKSGFATQICDYVNNSKPFPSGKLPGSEMNN
jgi:hypothetical protein